MSVRLVTDAGDFKPVPFIDLQALFAAFYASVKANSRLASRLTPMEEILLPVQYMIGDTLRKTEGTDLNNQMRPYLSILLRKDISKHNKRAAIAVIHRNVGISYYIDLALL